MSRAELKVKKNDFAFAKTVKNFHLKAFFFLHFVLPKSFRHIFKILINKLRLLTNNIFELYEIKIKIFVKQ